MTSDSELSVCVLGLGYIGLPTAAVIARTGAQVLGVDVTEAVVETVNSGKVHIEEVDLDGLVSGVVARGSLRASTQIAPANVFVIAFGMSWGPVMWIMLGEMFPNAFRGAALAVAGFAQWAANWLVTVTFPALKDISLGLAYGLYAFFAALSFAFVWKFVHETKGLALEDMEDGFVPAGH